MVKKLLPLLAIVFLLLNSPVFASNDKSHEKRDENKIEVKVNSNSNRAVEDNKHGDDDENDLKIKIEESENKFEVKGEISTVSANSFVIAGQTINIDPSKVEKFKIKGILEAGNSAKVEGVIVDNVKYAEEIKLIGTGQGRFKFEISGVTTNISLSPSGSPSASPIASVSPDATPSASPSPEVSANVKVKAVGPVDQVIQFFSQILGFLTNLGSTPSPSPTPTPIVSPSPTVTPSPIASPDVSPSPGASPSPLVSPSPEVSPSPTPDISPSPLVTPSPTPTSSPNSTIAHVSFKFGLTPITSIIDTIENLINTLQNLV